MILVSLGYPLGKFADVVRDPLGWTCVLQDEADGHLKLLQLDDEGERRVPDVTIAANGGNAFPVLKGGAETWLAFRDGATNHGVLMNLTAARTYDLDAVHGNSPIAFGEGYCAYQASADYAIQGRQLADPSRLLTSDAHGRPTGLSSASPNGVVLVDDVRFSVPGMLNPRRAGRVVVGENATGEDRNIARHDDGREAQLWPGLISNTPRIATDGGTWAVATWGGPGARLALLTDADFFAQPATPAPMGTPVTAPKALAYWFDFGRYGTFNPKRNATVIGSGMFADGAGKLPADVDTQLAGAIATAGRAFLAAGNIDNPGIDWSKVLAVFDHEPGSPADTRAAVAATRSAMRALGRPARPVIAVLTPDAIGNAAYRDTADALAFEIYLDAPAGSWDAQVKAVLDRMADALVSVAPTPVYFVVQAYDRSNPAWQARPDALEAIQAAANMFLPHDRVLGLWWFAYGRPGGVVTYPQLEAWHAAQVAVTPAPPLPSAPPVPVPPTKPEPKPMNLPNDEQMVNAMRRIHLEGYIGELKRAGGIFETPDASSQIYDPRPYADGGEVEPERRDRIDDRSLSVWTGRYVRYFAGVTSGDPHEFAIRKVIADLHNSDEARQKRGETGGGAAQPPFSGPIAVAGRFFTVPG